jgi:hypothetical protein
MLLGKCSPRCRVERAYIWSFCVLLAVVLAADLCSGASFECAIRASCNSNETLLIRLNSSESGAAPNNSHAQLANYSGDAYSHEVCCWTTGSITLNNSCIGTSTAVLSLFDTTNSHVQAANMSGYVYDACINYTASTLTCEYPDTSCSAGYTGILSIASTEAADGNLTNAHVADFNLYQRKVCCAFPSANPPTVSLANITPYPTATTRDDLSCINGIVFDIDGDAVSLHYNWFRNGTSLTALNWPMSSNGTHTFDISTNNRHGTLDNVTMITSGVVGTAFRFAFPSAINISQQTLFLGPNNMTLSVWVNMTTNNFDRHIIGNGECAGDLLVNQARQGVYFSYPGCKHLYSKRGSLNDSKWHHFAVVLNYTNLSLYIDGVFDNSTTVSLMGGGEYLGVQQVGARGNNVNFFTGSVDELIYFRRAMSAEEIWYLNLTKNKDMGNEELTRADRWNCSITPVDATGLNGSTVRSPNTTIIGAMPLLNLVYPANNNQSVFERFVNFTWNGTDYDKDEVNYTFNLTVMPGTCSVQTDQSNLQRVNFTYGELCADQLYNWTVTACDFEGCNTSAQFNFTIASVAGLRLVVNLTQFGTFSRGQSKATDADNIAPLIVNNTGNVRINITLNGTNDPFTTSPRPTTDYQFKAGTNASNAFNATGSQTTYTPVDAVYKNLIRQLNYSSQAQGYAAPVNSTARIDMNITAPINEPAGNKQGNITVQAVAG